MQNKKYGVAFLGSLLLVSVSWLLLGYWENQNLTAIPTSSDQTTLAPSATTTVIIIPRTTVTATPSFTSTPTVTPTQIPTQPANGERTVIGYSVEGRELEVFQFGNGPTPLMIVAGIHGGYEWNTISLADALMEKIITHDVAIPDGVTLFILRNLNPDGYERDKGPDGRANTNNVDLNRNWDSNWKETWWGTQCWSLQYITAGSEPESEPETKALKQFILDKKIEQIISYHSAGLGIFSGEARRIKGPRPWLIDWHK